MKLKGLAPILTTDKLDETIDFYTKILGFKCVGHDKETGWASVSRDKVLIMFSAPNAHIAFDKPEFTGSLYMYSDDVVAEWEKINKNVSVCYPLEVFDYGMKEFGFYDNNGYLLKYGQSAK